MDNEIWRDIDGYIGLYQVSNYGRVKSLDNYDICNGYKRFRKGKILKQTNHNQGYKSVNLYKDKKAKTYTVHRLVAQEFLPNPNNLPEVNHKDENKLNNCVENLEWCDKKYNMNYGTCIQRMTEKLTNRKDFSKPVLQFTKYGVFVAEYPSTTEAHRQTGVNQSSISHCCRKKPRYKSAGGFVWCYKEKEAN